MSDTAEELVILNRYPTIVDANLVASKLDAHGVQAVVEPHHAADLFPHMEFTLHRLGVAVWVRQEDLYEARQIMGLATNAEPWGKIAEIPLQRDARKLLQFTLLSFVIFPLVLPFAIGRLRRTWALYQRDREQVSDSDRRRAAVYLTISTVLSAIGLLMTIFILGVLFAGSSSLIWEAMMSSWRGGSGG